MTFNKSQEQGFNIVGIHIKKIIFSYGQLYAALSRCSIQNNIFIQNDSSNKDNIENIVWKSYNSLLTFKDKRAFYNYLEL